MLHGVKRILIVDEFRLLMEALAWRIDQETDLKIVGTATDCESGLATALDLNPDLVMVDVNIPGQGCLDLISRLVVAHPETHILLMAGSFCSTLLDHALRFASVRGCFDKRDSLNVLIEALRKISAGECYFSQSFLPRLQYDAEEEKYRVAGDVPGSSLTTRQLEILRYLATGMSVKEIATVMNRTEKAIESHKYRIMNRLNIRDRVVLARYAIRERLAPL